MCFSWPEHSGFLLLLIPLVVLFGFGFMRQIEARELFARGSEVTGSGRKRQFLSRMLQFSGIAMLLFALTGPGLCRGDRVMFRKGADVVFMLDVSSSMLAADVAPDRLELARDAVLRISSRVPEGRRALLLFAGAPLAQCPLTHDRDAFEALLGMASPVLIEEQGTAFGPAVDQSLRLLSVPSAKGGDVVNGEKIMVLLSDGEDHEGGVAAAAEKVRRAGVSLFVLGVGRRGEAVIPDLLHPGEVKRDEGGDAVKTRFTPETLMKLARASGGLYVDAAAGRDSVYDRVAARINRIVEGSRLVVSSSAGGYPLYYHLLGTGIALLLCERILRGRRLPPGR